MGIAALELESLNSVGVIGSWGEKENRWHLITKDKEGVVTIKGS